MRVRPMLAAVTAAAFATGMAMVPAGAAEAPVLVTQGLAGPLSLSVNKGKVTVAQSAAGKLSRVAVDGTGLVDLYQIRPDVEVSGVESAGHGTDFTLTGKTESGKPFAKLVHLSFDGKVSTRASLLQYEQNRNPDGATTYGFRRISPRCADTLPKKFGKPSRRGAVKSHPYATALMPDGSTVVADAAGNDIVRVSKKDVVSTVAVLPPQPLKLTKAAAAVLKLPRCTVGLTYRFEPVPTDVEVHGGNFYVTTLPGGPESPGLGARGKVYRVNPSNGRVTLVAKGFLGATNLAVTDAGAIYVTELLGNRVSTIVDGVRTSFLDLAAPSAIEWSDGALYATTDTFVNGSVVRIVP